MSDGSTDNSRVTLAVLDTKLVHLQKDFEAFRVEVREWRKESDDLGNRVTRNEEKLRTTTGVLGALQLVLAAVAAWIGVQR